MYIKKILFPAAMLLLAATAWAQGPNNTGIYYQNADGKKGSSLKTAMHTIIKITEGTGYDKLYAAYYTTDVREDGKLWDMYSSVTNYELGTDENHSNYKKEGDNYNREHSFPRSWFGGKVEPMNSDIHHVYPTDSWINGQRGNLPYGEVGSSYNSSKEGFSKWGKSSIPGYSGTVFEPNDEYKGDIARTYFYMATSYEDKIAGWKSDMLDNDSYETYKPWAMEMLLRWAAEDPVSEKEIKRNNAAEEIQGNRNPFIDYPGLEQYIWGKYKEYVFSYDKYAPNPEDSAIEGVTADEKECKMYDITGREVNENYKGIVIKNGKKQLAN